MKSRQYRFIYFKDYLPQILLSPFLNVLSHLLVVDNCRNFIQNFKLYQTSKVVTYNKNVIQNFNLYQTSKIVTYNKNFRYDFKTICFYFILFYFYCILLVYRYVTQKMYIPGHLSGVLSGISLLFCLLPIVTC